MFAAAIYGYGFNDDHFDTALFDSFQKNVLILSREVKQEIVDKAIKKKKSEKKFPECAFPSFTCSAVILLVF